MSDTTFYVWELHGTPIKPAKDQEILSVESKPSKPKVDAGTAASSAIDNKIQTKEEADKSEVPRKPTTRRTVKYLNNRDLCEQVRLSKIKGEMTNELAKMLTMLTARYATRAQFAGYTYNDDMQAFAMMSLVRTWKGFNLDRSNNPFAYYTQCIKNSFRLYLRNEKKQRTVKDELMVSVGLNPSYGYQIDHENTHDYDDFVVDSSEMLFDSRSNDDSLFGDGDNGPVDNNDDVDNIDSEKLTTPRDNE